MNPYTITQKNHSSRGFRMRPAVLQNLLCLSTLLLLCAPACSAARPELANPLAHAPAPHSFVVSGRQFLMDGKPYQIISGEMHYPAFPGPTGEIGFARPGQ